MSSAYVGLQIVGARGLGIWHPVAWLRAVWLKFAAQQRLGERVWLIPSQAIQAGPLLRVLSCVVGQDCRRRNMRRYHSKGTTGQKNRRESLFEGTWR